MASAYPLNRYFELTVELTAAAHGRIRATAPLLRSLDITRSAERIREDLPAALEALLRSAVLRETRVALMAEIPARTGGPQLLIFEVHVELPPGPV